MAEWDHEIEQARLTLESDMRRCDRTGNPCGTDTRKRNSPCLCLPCVLWMQDEIEQLRQDVEDYEAIFARKGDEITELRSEVTKWKYAAESHLQASWRCADEVGRLKAERDDLRRQLDAANKTLSIYAKTLATKQEKIERLESNTKIKL